MNQTLVAALIFVVTYGVIVTERVHRTTAALLGGMFLILLGVLDQDEAFRVVDLNVIFLLVGMMVIAYYLSETGVFQWLAIQAVRLGRGHPLAIMVIIAGITAVVSALLDNVTVVVLIVPVTLYVASVLRVSPIPFLISEVMASNIGGASTLVGDPPNVLIASRANIDFVRFLVNMGPPAFIALALYFVIIVVQFRDLVHVPPERRKALTQLETRGLITDPKLLFQAGSILFLVMIGFTLHSVLHLKPATIALAGAALLLLWTRHDPHKALQHVEWSTLMFFTGLFIVVEGLVVTGIVEQAADFMVRLTGGDLRVTAMAILWGSALFAGVMSNVPYTTAMLPIVESLGKAMPVDPLWWALVLGADFGGNLTLVGASANVVVASIAERSGHKLTFGMFLRYGVMTVVVSLLVSTVWIWWRYL